MKRDDVKRCKHCQKIIKPMPGCWFQVFCTGGKCRAAYKRKLAIRGRALAKKELTEAASH